MTTQPLVADAFSSDRRVLEAKALLREALREHGDRLDGARPADPGRAIGYAETLERFAQVRGGQLFYPYLGSGFGRGALVELADGSVKLDMICGIGVHYFGHGDPDLCDRLIDAALQDTVMQGNLQQTTASLTLSASLLELANRKGAALDHCFLTTSGATANENALKLVFQHHAPADRILAFDRAFAGRTLALSQITDNPAYRVGLPSALSVDFVPFFDARDPAASLERTLDALRSHLDRHPGRHAAMILELVQGEGGYYPGDPSFFGAVAELLRERGVAIWFDEIQTFGRTLEPFAFQHFGLDRFADVVTIGKTSQVCATLFAEAYRPGPGLISQTFTGATSAIVAGQYVVDRFAEGHLFGASGRVAEVSDRFMQGFARLSQAHPDWIRGPFGLGAMLAFTPFQGEKASTRRLLDVLFERGVVAFSTGGALARVRFLPPVGVILDQEIDSVLEILADSLAAVADCAASDRNSGGSS